MNNFTELMNLKDVKGRTSLHYAAAIEDNNYLYKTLINRGADTSIKDNAGKTPGQYNKSKKELNKAMLLSFMNGTVVTEEKKVKPIPAPASAAVKPSRKQILKSILKSMKSGPPPELEEQTFREDLDEESLLKVENIFKSLMKLKEKPQLGDKVHHILPIDEATFQKIKKRSEYLLECSSYNLYFRVCIQSGGSMLDVLDLCQHKAALDTCPSLPLLAPDPSAYQVFQELFQPWIEQHHQHKLDKK